MFKIRKPIRHSRDDSAPNLVGVEHVRREFAHLVASGNGQIDGHLDHAALLIATAIDPEVDVTTQLGRLDQLADVLGARSPGELAIGLFGGVNFDQDRHFGGNHQQYYDPDNSLLHRVLDRRVGIPISLSVLMIEVGRRQGISLHGVGMPGHFLVGSSEGYIDPFNGGMLMDEQGCEALFRRLVGPSAILPPHALDATAPAMILRRVLANLAAIAANQQHRSMLRAVWSLTATYPDADHRTHVQHAYAAAEVGQYAEAAMAGEQALLTVPPSLQDKLRAQIDAWRARLN